MARRRKVADGDLRAIDKLVRAINQIDKYSVRRLVARPLAGLHFCVTEAMREGASPSPGGTA
jgi:hypothetical protein